jgi:hypothetical protein
VIACAYKLCLSCARYFLAMSSFQSLQESQDLYSSSMFANNSTHVIINDVVIDLTTPLSEEAFEVSTSTHPHKLYCCYCRAAARIRCSIYGCHVLSIVKQSKVMKKLECWNAGTYVCYREQIDKWNSSQRSKADMLWVQYLEMIARLDYIKSAHHRTVFIDRSIDVEYQYALQSSCLATANGHDYSIALRSTENEHTEIASIDTTLDAVYHYSLLLSCLATDAGLHYSIASEKLRSDKTLRSEKEHHVSDTSFIYDIRHDKQSC